jgi:hypothetical protein
LLSAKASQAEAAQIPRTLIGAGQERREQMPEAGFQPHSEGWMNVQTGDDRQVRFRQTGGGTTKNPEVQIQRIGAGHGQALAEQLTCTKQDLQYILHQLAT